MQVGPPEGKAENSPRLWPRFSAVTSGGSCLFCSALIVRGLPKVWGEITKNLFMKTKTDGFVESWPHLLRDFHSPKQLMRRAVNITTGLNTTPPFYVRTLITLAHVSPFSSFDTSSFISEAFLSSDSYWFWTQCGGLLREVKDKRINDWLENCAPNSVWIISFMLGLWYQSYIINFGSSLQFGNVKQQKQSLTKKKDVMWWFCTYMSVH